MWKFSAIFLLFVSYLNAANQWIRINQLGYKTDALKVAVLGSHEAFSFDQFQIIEVLSGKVVYTGKKIEKYDSWASFKEIYRLHFSDFSRSGMFFIKAGNITSPKFKIADNIYNDAADFLLKYMRQQRCGYNPFLKDSCHTNDGFIVDFPERDSSYINVTGGWHDASDYLQYSTTSANATYQMLFAYQQNPTAFKDAYLANGNPGKNGIPDILDEAKWGLDWLYKMNPEKNIMFNQIADDRDHAKFTLPSLDTISYGKGKQRPVYFITGKPQGLGKYKNRATGVSSTAAKFASAFALGAQIMQPYYPDFSKKIAHKAQEAFIFAKSDLGVSQTASNKAPYFYEEDNYTDDMELAAAELFALNKEPYFKKEAHYWGKLEPVTPWMTKNGARHYQYYPFINLGHYKNAIMGDKAQKNEYTNYLKQGLDAIEQRGRENGFYFGIPFIWCSNNLVAATLTQIELYQQLTDSQAFGEMEAALRDWLLGCNPWGTSMIIGFPYEGDTPVDPHAAQTAVFNLTIDGGLVDGPVYTSIFNKLRGLRIVNGDEYAAFQSDLVVYHDDYGDYSTNEPTMDGTASLSYYFSSLAEKEIAEKDKNSYHDGALIKGDASKKELHLVFSGGKYGEGGEKIRKVLANHKIKAHFFFTGNFYRNPQFKTLIHNLIKDKHFLGAHSDQHLLYAAWEKRDSLLIDHETFINDLAANYNEMARFGIAAQQAKLYLPPYEWYNKTISRWTAETGLQLINFSSGTRSNADYTTPDMGKRYVDSKTIYESIFKFERESPTGLNGHILLMHIGSHPNRTDKFYHKLDELIIELKKLGYGFSLLSR